MKRGFAKIYFIVLILLLGLVFFYDFTSEKSVTGSIIGSAEETYQLCGEKIYALDTNEELQGVAVVTLSPQHIVNIRIIYDPENNPFVAADDFFSSQEIKDRYDFALKDGKNAFVLITRKYDDCGWDVPSEVKQALSFTDKELSRAKTACSDYDTDSCPYPQCTVFNKEIGFLRNFPGCENGKKSIQVCTKNPNAPEEVESLNFCYIETGYTIGLDIFDSKNEPIETSATYFYEKRGTFGWKFLIENGLPKIKIPELDGKEKIIEPEFILDFGNKHCNYYFFSHERKASKLKYDLPLKQEFADRQKGLCRYGLSDGLEEDLKILGVQPKFSICPDLVYWGKLTNEIECPATQPCEINVPEGKKEYFGILFEEDSCGYYKISEDEDGFSIKQEEILERAEKNVEDCSAKYVSQCSDLEDNDKDGKRDYPDDPGCFSNYDTDESDLSYSECIELYPGTNNANENRINVIFVGHGYDGLGQISGKIKSQVDALLELVPFKSYKEKFNFWLVGEIGNIENCEDRLMIPPFEESKYLHCPSDIAKKCGDLNNVFINNIINDRAASLNYRTRAFFSGGTMMLYETDITYRDTLFGHEFGHTFGLLSDEYVESTFPEFFQNFPNLIPMNGPNCYSTIEDTTHWQCMQNAPWKDMFGDGCGEPGVIDCNENDLNYNYEVGCFEGCAYFEHGAFRPTRCSLMKTHHDCERFGPVNEKAIEKRILDLTG